MRIVCQKCAAAYAIDDRLITAKGVRAQCPRCRHLQLVRRDPSAVPSAGAPAPAPQPAAPAPSQPAPAAGPADDLFGDFGAPPPAAEPKPAAPPRAAPTQRPAQSAAAAPDLFSDFGQMPSLGPTPAPPIGDPFADIGGPAPAPAPAPGDDPLLDFLGPAPTAPPAPVARMSGPPGSAPVPVAPPQPAAPAPRAAAPAPAAPKEATSGCRSCGKPLTDAFDQALGVCDDCRQRGVAPAKSAPAAPAPAPAAPAPVSMDFLPPLTTFDSSSSPESSAPALSAEPRSSPRAAAAPGLGAEPRSSPRAPAAPGSETRIPISTDIIPDLGPEPRSGQRAAGLGPEPRSASRMAPVRTAQASAPSRGKGVLLGVLGLLLAGGGAAGYFFHQQRQEEARRNAVPPAPPPLPAAVQAVLPRWKLRYLELSGTSAEHLAKGQQQLARDERFAYTEAEESFQQALLLDPNSDAAIAGYVQALALGRGAGLDDATFQEARALVEAAQSRSGRTAPLLLAHANLLLAHARQSGQTDKARTLAEEALNAAGATDAQKAEAHLVMGRAYLSTSRELARGHFDSAQQLAPDLKRVAYYRALAHESAGEYRLALETLRARLKTNPEDWDSLAATSRIYQEVGLPEEARKLYEAREKARPGELRAKLPLAMLTYQTEGTSAAAQAAGRELRALLKNRGRYEDRDVAEVLVHLAAAERTAGNIDAGAKAAEEALGLVKDLPEAHLQLFLIAVGRKDATKARAHLPGIQGRLEDPALEKVLEGRLLLLEKKPQEALERFQEAFKRDARRLDAQLLAGVASASERRRDDAFRALHQALLSDPMRLEPRPVATRFWLKPGETVDGVEGIILALATGDEDPSPRLYEGLLRFHQGDLDVAERHFRDVLEVDAGNAGAFAYRALIALKRRNTSEARTLAARAVAAGRDMPIAHLAMGMALAREPQQVEPAKRALREARTRGRGLLSAQALLAELDAPQRRDDARNTLVTVVGLDPAYLPAKQMLYQLDR